MSQGIGKFIHVEPLSTFTSDIDLTDTLPVSGLKFPQGAAAIFVKTAGTVVEVTFASGYEATFAAADDDSYLEPSPTQYLKIGSATDATLLWVGFN